MNETTSLVGSRRGFAALRPELLAGRTTPSAVLEHCIARIEVCEGQVQAFCALDLAAARRAADASTQRYLQGRPLSPIDGMVIGVKDLIDTIDHPTRMNSPLFAQYTPSADAECVRRLKAAGAVILGKTVTTEFGMGKSGPTRNPHDLLRTPGGSSSGAAASVATGMAHAGLATQTQGSILRPAAYCGVVGYKPSHGRLPVAGIHPAAPGMDHLGVIASTTEDCWLVEQALLGAVAPIPAPAMPRRIGLLDGSAIETLEDATSLAMEAAVARLQDAGVAVHTPFQDSALAAASAALAEAPELALDIVGAQMGPIYGPMIDLDGERVSARIHALVARGQALGAAGLARAEARRDELRRTIGVLFDTYDLLVLPAAPGPAPLGFEFTGSRLLQVPWTLLGFPAISVPVSCAGALPIGLQLCGGPRSDGALLTMAAAVSEKLVDL